jgi:hypothetical protein
MNSNKISFISRVCLAVIALLGVAVLAYIIIYNDIKHYEEGTCFIKECKMDSDICCTSYECRPCFIIIGVMDLQTEKKLYSDIKIVFSTYKYDFCDTTKIICYYDDRYIQYSVKFSEFSIRQNIIYFFLALIIWCLCLYVVDLFVLPFVVGFIVELIKPGKKADYDSIF